MTWTGFYRHTNGTDTLYAMPLAAGAFTDVGIVTGSDTNQNTLYVFASLVDGSTYEVRIRAGVDPAAGDLAIASLGKVPAAGSGLPIVVPAIEADAIVNGLDTEVTRYRSTRWILQALDIGAQPAKLYCTIKRGTETDAQAVVQIVVSNPPAAGDGLIVLNGATPADKAFAKIEVFEYDDGGDTKLRAIATIEAAATNHRPDTYRVDFKEVDSPGVLAEARIRVIDSVTDATS